MLFSHLRNSITPLHSQNPFSSKFQFLHDIFLDSPRHIPSHFSHSLAIIYVYEHTQHSFVIFVTGSPISNDASINNWQQICYEQIKRSMLLITGNSKEFNVCNLKLAMNKEIRTHFYFAYTWNTHSLTGFFFWRWNGQIFMNFWKVKQIRSFKCGDYCTPTIREN